MVGKRKYHSFNDLFSYSSHRYYHCGVLAELENHDTAIGLGQFCHGNVRFGSESEFEEVAKDGQRERAWRRSFGGQFNKGERAWRYYLGI